MKKPATQLTAPREHGWDIAFTRLSLQVMPQVETCLRELAQHFHGIGLSCDRQVRQTPRGLSAFLAVVGRRGLLFIVDITLIDGMAVDSQAGAALHIRLLDACGDTVAHCSSQPVAGAPQFESTPEGVLAAAGLRQAVTSIYVTAIAHFDLVPKAARQVNASSATGA
jgi:hypothetical protein